MYKIAFVGDLHCSPSNYKDIQRSLELVTQVLLDEDIYLVIQLGDIFDFYNISSGQTAVSTVVHAVKDIFHDWASRGITVHIIEGNHDKAPKGHQGTFYRSSINLLREDGVFAHTKPTVWQHSTGTCDVCFAFLPWCEKDEMHLVSAAKKYFTELGDHIGCKILVGHFNMEDATVNGIELPYGDFYFSHEELASWNADFYIAGHIHHRQLIYPGVIMHNSLSDAGSPTGIKIITINDDGELVDQKFVELKTKKYHLIEVNTSDPDAIRAAIAGCNDYDSYVVYVYDKQQTRVASPHNVEIRYKPKVEVTSRVQIDKDKAFNMTMVEAWQMWAERNKYSKPIIRRGIEIMKEQGVD